MRERSDRSSLVPDGGRASGRRSAPALAAAVFPLLASLGPSPVAAGSEAPTFGEVVEVRLVTLEVVASDAGGVPVTDLTPADFALFEDGARMELSHVELIGEPSAGRPSGASPGAGPRVPSPPAEDTPVQLAIYLDEVHVGAASRIRILRQMADVLAKSLRAGDRVMVVRYDGSTGVVLPFTSDRKALAAALTEVETVSMARLVTESDWRYTIDALYQDASGEHGWSPCLHIQEFVESYAQKRQDEVGRAIDAFGRFVDSLAGIVGRKAVLHVSDGIPTRPGAEASEYAQELCNQASASQGSARANTFPANTPDIYDAAHRTLEASAYDTSARWEEVAARANAGNVSIYTFQAGPTASLSTIEYPQARPTAALDASSKANRQESLFLLADRSGGRAWLDGTDLERELATTVRELQSYYLLSYTPPATAAAGVRHVRLEVTRPGVSVRYRKLYRPRTAYEQVADGLIGRLLYSPAGETSPLRLDLASREPAPQTKVKARFRLQVPMGSLTLAEQSGLRQGQFTAFVAVADSRGLTSPVRQALVPVRLAPAGETAPTHFVWEVEMLLRPEVYHVAVAVHDELSGDTSFLVRRFDVHRR